MKNFIQPGSVLTVPAPTGGVTSGGVVLLNSLLGVAAFDAEEAADVEVKVDGVFEVPKLSTDVVAIGDVLYWDATAGNMTKTATNNTRAGLAAQVAGNGTTLVQIKLTPGVA